MIYIIYKYECNNIVTKMQNKFDSLNILTMIDCTHKNYMRLKEALNHNDENEKLSVKLIATCKAKGESTRSKVASRGRFIALAVD